MSDHKNNGKSNEKSCTNEEVMKKTLDEIIERAKAENSALRKILHGIEEIQKKEMGRRMNYKTTKK